MRKCDSCAVYEVHSLPTFTRKFNVGVKEQNTFEV